MARQLTDEEASRLDSDWYGWGRDDQLAPDGISWRTWLLLGGRGAGKTRAGAEWIRALAEGLPPYAPVPGMRIALVGETMQAVRSVMVEGVSGILAVHPPHERPVLEPSKQQLVWASTGAIAQLFSAEDPDGLRGPQFHAAWCDELCKWRYAERTWDMLQFALRLGDAPRQVVTTTPRPIPLLNTLVGDAHTITDRARTIDNRGFLPEAFISEIMCRYSGTALGRQELDGEIINEVTGALWKREWLEHARVAHAPELARIVVAVDPPVTATPESDACGIIVAGLGVDGRGYVVADRTLEGRDPATWARGAVAAYKDHAADRIVAEANQGGDLVESVIRQVDPNVPIRLVKASRGKWVRAEPVSALYAQGRVSHVGEHRALEAQMLAFGSDGLSEGRSPDRLDALVWAMTELILDAPPPPSVRVI